ncbi:MAG: PEP/pyruvate-binding domain-containing protein [Desulfobacteraceae bacterium]
MPVNPKLKYMASDFDTHFKVFHELMSNKVLEILLVASAYDAYILEEDGSLASKIINEYRGLNLSRPPRLTRVDGAKEALERIAAESFDLVITMPHLDDMDPFELGRAIKQSKPDLPVVLLAHSVSGLFPMPENKDSSGIDQIYIWSGDADLLLAIVKNVEDRRNVERDTVQAQVRVIILVEDSPLYRSYFLPLMYKEVVHQTQEVLDESLNEEHRLLKMRARPKILVAETYEAAQALYERYQPFMFGVVADTRFPRNGKLCEDAGVQFLSGIKKEIPDLPVLLISNESKNRRQAATIPALFLDKNSPQLFEELHGFFLDHLGFGDFIFRNADGNEIARAANLRQLEEILPDLPDEPLCYHASRNRFSNWIMARSEIHLASQMRQLHISDFPDIAAMRQYLIGSIHGLRKWRQKGVVIQFDARTFDSQIADIAKIGKGSLGGKARGLAFVSNLLRQSSWLNEKYPGIDIRVPPSLVITTEGFDHFVDQNQLERSACIHMADEEISDAFALGKIPEQIEADLVDYLKSVRGPLSVRSSSLLEDAHHQPLVGLYDTYMIPNDHPDDTVRLAQLTAAIKQVYASAWFAEPRRFALSTAFRHRKELMAVLIQQIVGSAQNSFFYPSITGVARSQNYYPIDRIEPDDGMAKIAVGFGKILSTGEGGLRFCPKYPNSLPDFSKTEDILANAQKHFYALPIQSERADLDLKVDLVLRNAADATSEPPLFPVLSTYLPEDGRIRDSTAVEGTKLITFAPILKHKTFPLADLLSDLLIFGRQGMGCHVEFEFAMNLDISPRETPVFYILQMRPMPIGSDPFEVGISDTERTGAVCYSTQALGHGIQYRIADLVYVKPDAFDPSQTHMMVREVARINAALKADNRPYLLAGPGRWGSFDPLLGIPVKWDDIDGAAVIVELRNASLKADPSKGSHFFQQITTHGIFYLTVDEEGHDRMAWAQLIPLPVYQESDHLCHIRLAHPLVVKCNGRDSQGVVLLPDGI